MSAETLQLRRAVAAIRADYSDPVEAAFENAVADWLSTTADLWNQGVSDRLNRDALSVARAFLGVSA